MNGEHSPARAEAALQRKVLRGLFLKLMFRGRVSSKRKWLTNPKAAFAISVISFGALGLVALAFSSTSPVVFTGLLHSLTLLTVAINLAASSSTVLFNPQESDVLLHRPIDARALLESKVQVLLLTVGALALALNVTGLLIGFSRPDLGLRFVAAHLFSSAGLLLFTVSSVVLTYNLCLRWFGRDKLENLMTAVQVIVAMTAILAGQLAPRLLRNVEMESLGGDLPLWMFALPPAWFAALDMVLLGRADWPVVYWLAGAAVFATVAVSWYGVHFLAATYERGLVALNETSGGTKTSRRTRRPWSERLLRLPGVSLWLRGPVERAAFRLCLAQLGRSRGVKLRVYPVVAQFMVYPFIVLGGATGTQMPKFAIGFSLAYAGVFLAMLPGLVADRLRASEDFRAADVFWYTPLASPAALFHGTRKAITLLFTVPGLALVLVAGAIWLAEPGQLVLLLPGVVAIPLFGILPALFSAFVPFSEPPDVQTQSAQGCLMMFALMMGSMVLGGIATWAWSAGWLHWLLAGEAIAVAVFSFLFARVAGNRQLPKER